MSSNTHQLGIMFRRERPPDQLTVFAKAAEAASFDELWVVEDCFWASGIAPAAVALATTQRITVGLGIMGSVRDTCKKVTCFTLSPLSQV